MIVRSTRDSRINKSKEKVLLFLLTLILNSINISAQTSPDSSYHIFLIGDAGAPKTDSTDLVLGLLKKKMDKAGEQSAVIYLGDNIYPNGLPPEDFKGRKKAEDRLKAQLYILQNYKGKAFMVPGNHDWKEGGRLGLKYLKEEEKLVESYLGSAEFFFPKDGCPGPVEINLSESITLIMIDTQWFLHPWDKPGEDSDCDSKDASSFINNLEDMLERNKEKRIIVAAHHPMYSHGPHGGYYPLKYHIFPLTDANKHLYIPFPVLGSIYPLYRGLIGSLQDIPNPKYRLMKNEFLKLFKDYPGIIYAAGHDHTLQFTLKDSLNHIISGAGSKFTYVNEKAKDGFARATKGFAEVIINNGSTDSVIYYGVGKEPGSEKIIFKTALVKNPLSDLPKSVTTPKQTPDSITITGSKRYHAGKFKNFMMGENYRKEWAAEIKVPVFKLNEEKEGLKILKKGGGMQTKSLRLEDSTGKEYVLRSIEKYPENAMPTALRGSFAEDLVQDQISAAHPYAAVAVSKLAESVNIPHTHPKIVFIPDDPTFGIYQKTFRNTLALFEERNPEDDLDKKEKIKSTAKVIENLQEDNDNSVDEKAVLKARLFDLIIGDWDRHDDQWRWSEEKKKKRKIYHPLPRDRDQAFFVNQGVLPKIASRRWALPKIQGFDEEIGYVEGFMYNGRYFDRSFLTGLSKKEWIEVAQELKSDLTDNAIEASLKDLPPAGKSNTNKVIVNKLKKRRNDLKEYAVKYYQFLAKAVDITGSDKKEYFSIKTETDGTVEVNVIKTDKKDELEDTLYSRKFYPEETKEIRLYGLGGDDKFISEGESGQRIKVRIIGGAGNDEIRDNSKGNILNRKIYVYDTKSGNNIDKSSNIKNRTSENPEVNEYNRKSFKYDLFAPLLSAQFNVDDGVFLGGGFLYKKNGFRKEPFAQKHLVTGNYAINTSSFNFSYTGQFTDVVKKWDFLLDLDLKIPNYVNNFFGLGNETVYNEDINIRYYRVRYRQASLGAYFIKNIGRSQTFFFGPQIARIDVEENPDRFINNFPENGLEVNNTFNTKDYAGVRLAYNADTRDNVVIPTSGVRFNIQYDYLKNPDQSSFNLSQLQSAFTFYLSFRLPAKLTLASRFGGGIHFGDYEFYQANYLSGVTNLRGFRKSRFGGKSSFYNNIELRLKLFSFRSYLLPATVGLLAFNDVGRVWEKDETSSKWHDGAGGGIWIAPFNQVVVTVMMGFSEEKSVPMVKMGFMF